MKTKTKRRARVAGIIIVLLYLVTHQWVWHPRFWQLQFLGRVPDESPCPFHLDWRMAQKTWWWGNRIDPKEFWGGRTIWLDADAMNRARRRGRGYPPMPYEDPSLKSRSNRGTKPSPFGHPDSGPVIRYVSSSRENAFWDKFAKTHPHPPEDIETWLVDNASSWLHNKHLLEHEPEKAARFRIRPDSVKRMLDTDLRDARTFGYPPECVTSNAYFWANTKPLTDDQKQQAAKWKIAYLLRLHRDGTDDSYINAYLKEWNLTPSK